MRKETTGSRLKEYIFKYYDNQKHFADLLEISPSLINRYINDSASPGLDNVIKFQLAGLSIDWLTSGEGLPLLDISFIENMRKLYKGNPKFENSIKNLMEYEKDNDIEKEPFKGRVKLEFDDEILGQILNNASKKDLSNLVGSLISRLVSNK
jgi:transcriptional regulator with XRE-family HTH domain